jgi:hypothetical protein
MSMLIEHATDMETAWLWLADHLHATGMEHVTLMPSGSYATL